MPLPTRRARAVAVLATCLLATGLVAARSTAVSPPAAPRVGHFFILMLENKSFSSTFGPGSPAPYLADSLSARGALLREYYGIGHVSLDNYIALVSGQAPNRATQTDCARFTEFVLTEPKLNADGQAIGTGCVYPTMVKMIGDQLEAAHLTWRGYMEDLGNDSTKESASCGHPTIGSIDSTTNREAGDVYATKHNPFYYFHTLIDNKARCASHVVNLRQLEADLQSVSRTPNYVFISPNQCNDGHDTPCVDGGPGGLAQADSFLKKWVPRITSSPAFKQDGLLLITFDEASGPPGQDTSACCGEKGLPGQERPPGWTGPGGGKVGAVILSPFVKPGTVSNVPYNHYSTLRWVEDNFRLKPLGYAKAKLETFGADVFGR